MMRGFSVILMVMSALLLVGCSSKVEWNQKLTVTVEIDGQEYVGSSVAKMVYTGAGKVAFGSRGVTVSERFYGEAVVVDLGEYGHLFALWRNQNGEHAILTQSKKRKARSSPSTQSAKTYKHAKRNNMSFLRKASNSGAIKVLEPGDCQEDLASAGKFKRSSGSYPLLVAFKKPTFPSTITGFNQCGENWRSGVFDAEAFSKFYGGKVKVKSITFQVTDEPLTEGQLNAVLSDTYLDDWRKKAKRFGFSYKCIRATNNPYFCELHKGDFRKRVSGETK